MKTVKNILMAGVFCIISQKTTAQELPLVREKPSFADTAIAMVRSLPEVMAKENQLLKQSKGQKHAIYWVTSDGLGLFTVKVMEDNGTTQVTHFTFDVDSASFRVLKSNSKP